MNSHRPLWMALTLLLLVLGAAALRPTESRRQELGPVAEANDRAERSEGDLESLPDSPSERQAAYRPSESRSSTAELLTVSTLPFERGAPPEVPGATLRLILVDAQTGDPIPKLGFEIYRERGGNRVLAEGTTDATGQALIEDLESNVVLVRTAHRPPFARAFGAVWLDPGEEKRLELKVTHGGRVIGRLVDSLGSGLEGLSIRVASAGESSEVLAVSDVEGRFSLDAITPTPKGIWIKENRMAPERMNPMEFSVWGERIHRGTFAADPPEGQTVDLGDLPMKNVLRFRGRVVDQEGQPVEGALVGVWYARNRVLNWGAEIDSKGELLLPIHADHPAETHTSPDGRYEFRSATWAVQGYLIPRDQSLIRWTPFNLEHTSEVPGVIEFVDLVVPIQPLFVAEFVDAKGRRVSTNAKGAERMARPTGRTHLGGSFRRVDVYLYSESEEVRHIQARQSPDDLLRVRLPAGFEDPSAVRILFPGYLPIFADLRAAGMARPGRSAPYRFELTPRLELKGRLHVWDDRPGTGHEPRNFTVSCEVSPVPTEEYGAESGLGSELHLDLKQGTTEFTLPVLSNEPFWIHLKGWRCLFSRDVFGPFEPGEEAHEFEVAFTEESKEAALARRRTRSAPENVKNVRLRVIAADGNPPPETTSISQGRNQGEANAEGEGAFRIRGELEGPILASQTRADSSLALQVVDAWKELGEESLVVELGEWHEVTLRVHGLDEARQRLIESIPLIPQEIDRREPISYRARSRGLRLPDGSDGAARWSFVLGEGTWVLFGDSPLTQGLEGEIDVLRTAERQTFEIWAK